MASAKMCFYGTVKSIRFLSGYTLERVSKSSDTSSITTMRRISIAVLQCRRPFFFPIWRCGISFSSTCWNEGLRSNINRRRIALGRQTSLICDKSDRSEKMRDATHTLGRVAFLSVRLVLQSVSNLIPYKTGEVQKPAGGRYDEW